MVRVSDDDYWMLVMCTVRYSLGRQSYMPTEICNLVWSRGRPELTDPQLRQLRNEVQSELDRAVSMGRLLGSQVDHDAWVQLVAKIDRIF